MENQYDDQLFSVKELARKVQIERSYLYRLFKKYLNINPKQYILQYRINKSTELLQKSSYSIEEIAYLVGFNSPSHFSRQFSNCKSLSPSKYRSKIKVITTNYNESENKLAR
ncbi:helix-turn-helix domain-containing protein [Cerasibacillus sp. JNUCC 74]